MSLISDNNKYYGPFFQPYLTQYWMNIISKGQHRSLKCDIKSYIIINTWLKRHFTCYIKSKGKVCSKLNHFSWITDPVGTKYSKPYTQWVNPDPAYIPSLQSNGWCWQIYCITWDGFPAKNMHYIAAPMIYHHTDHPKWVQMMVIVNVLARKKQAPGHQHPSYHVAYILSLYILLPLKTRVQKCKMEKPL